MPRPVEPGRWRPQHGMRAYRRLRRRLIDGQHGKCAECGLTAPLELHHRIPVEHGGEDSETNLIGLCTPCHFSIHDRGPGPDRRAWRAELARLLSE